MQTSANPTIRVSPAPAPPPRRFPILVVAVVRELTDASDEGIQAIKKFCLEENVMFETRQYDSYKYRHDRDEIERLPALHLYVQQIHEKTFYPNGRPFQIIDDAICAHLERMARAHEKRQKRKSLWKRLLAALKKLGHRETRMERAERERHEVAERARRNSMDGRGRAMSMADWN